jgi:capsular polysaccharide transport system permease protein
VNEHIKVEALQKRPVLTAQQWRARVRRISAFFCVIVPTILAAGYFFLIAANQYAVEVRFAVRGPQGAPSTDMLSMVTGVTAAGSTVTDAYILMDYLRSRQLLEELSKKIDFEEVFNSPRADFLTAFPVRKRSIERFVEYWKGMAHINFDTTSQIIVLEIRTFEPQHSKKLADEVLRLCENLVNRLSERSRNDALKMANAEVDRQEERMRRSAAAMRAFREKTQDVDPTKSAAAQIGRLSVFESQLSTELAKLATQQTWMNEKAPAIEYTKSKIAALEKQVEAERARLGQGTAPGQSGAGTLSGAFEDYQTLLTEMEFAQKAYVLAQSSLEASRVSANQQQRYLATFVTPGTPQEALYPQRLVNTLIISALCFCIWFIGLMIVYGIRDHAR